METVEVESQELEQRRVTHLEQPRAEALVWTVDGSNVRSDVSERQAADTPLEPEPQTQRGGATGGHTEE